MVVASHGSKAGLYINGYNWTPYMKSLTLSRTTDTVESSALGTTAKTYHPSGLVDATLAGEGYYDGSSSAPPITSDFGFTAMLGAAVKPVACYAPVPQTLGAPLYGMECDITTIDESAPMDGLVTLDSEFQSSRGAERGVILRVLANASSTGNGTAVDLGSGTFTFGGVSYLQETVTSGASHQVKIEDSADGSTGWAVIATHTARTTIGAERIQIAGTVRRWVRAQWTVASGSMTFTVAFKRYIQ